MTRLGAYITQSPLLRLSLSGFSHDGLEEALRPWRKKDWLLFVPQPSGKKTLISADEKKADSDPRRYLVVAQQDVDLRGQGEGKGEEGPRLCPLRPFSVSCLLLHRTIVQNSRMFQHFPTSSEVKDRASQRKAQRSARRSKQCRANE